MPEPAAQPTDRLRKLLALLEKDPHDAFCLYGVAQEHASAGRHEEALAWFDRTIAADPTSAYAFFHKARSQEALGQRPEAVETLRQGKAAAMRGQDNHALAEIQGYLDELEDA
ncbi:MAG: hypothetical protein U0636_03335 [Phycisphaerales bacterium]